MATACALFQKYGITVNYCHDRCVADSRGREICGYTPQNGDRVIIIDDLISSGKNIDKRIEKLLKKADVVIAAIVVIANRYEENTECVGSKIIEKKYNTKVYSIISHNDIRQAIVKHII